MSGKQYDTNRTCVTFYNELLQYWRKPDTTHSEKLSWNHRPFNYLNLESICKLLSSYSHQLIEENDRRVPLDLNEID